MLRDESDNNSYGEEKQKELFAEFETQSMKRQGHAFRREMAFRKKIVLNLSYENLVILFIAVIMLMVVFFSLGVENGKRVALKNIVPLTAEAFHGTPEQGKTIVREEAGTANIKDTGKPDTDRAAGETGNAETSLYTIQVVAFKKEANARKEISLLKKEWREVFIIPTNDWQQVCVGRYESKEDTQKDFDILKNEYPTCYIRKIE